MRKILVAFLIIFLLAGGVYGFIQRRNAAPQPDWDTKPQIYSQSGEIISLGAGQLQLRFSSGIIERTVVFNSQTPVFKLVKEEEGYSERQGSLSDLKVGAEIVVYSKIPLTETGLISASKIHIIPAK